MARELAAANLDWDYFLRFVEPHKALPIVSCHVRQTLSEMIPPRVCDELRLRAIRYGKRAETLSDELAAVLTAFEGAGIAAVPLKGPTLIEHIWGDCRLAACDDLDILVRASDAQTATEVLARCGYHHGKERADGVPRWKLGTSALVVFRDHPMFFRIWLQLHTPYFLKRCWIGRFGPIEHLWERLRRGRFRGAPVWYLPDDWNLLLIALHSLRHSFVTLLCAAELHGLLETAHISRKVCLPGEGHSLPRPGG
ncbi:nucleotidyltransferase family protein [Candidatus Sumerlaeota bacterium]|nr:nucleotidyltransferase family protein [Candidatus Sumerlaeota bacterium]